MRIDILTLFPAMFDGPLTASILGRARDAGHVDIRIHDLRTFGKGSYKQIDDKPYGGGVGMVMMAEPLVTAIEAIEAESGSGERKSNANKPHRIYLSPRGKRLDQEHVETLSTKPWLLFVCGHYEGIDQRVIDGGWIDEELSIGDYVLTGGELPAMVVIDAVARQLPGVLGKDESSHEESFSKELGRKKEYPHYTRPEEFRGLKVPEVLINGNHQKIAEWRKDQTT